MGYRKAKYSNYIINSLTRRNIVRPLATLRFTIHRRQRSCLRSTSIRIDVYIQYTSLSVAHFFFHFYYRSGTDPHIISRTDKKKHTQITNSVYRIIFSGQHTPIVWCVFLFVWTVCVFIYCLLITLATIGEISNSIADSREMFLFVTLNLNLIKFNFLSNSFLFNFFCCCSRAFYFLPDCRLSKR